MSKSLCHCHMVLINHANYFELKLLNIPPLKAVCKYMYTSNYKSGLSFEAGGPTFVPVVYHFTSGTQ